MSKKTYLLLALLCASLVLFVAPAFAATQEVQSWDISSENPGWTLEGDWAFGVPLGLGGDPDTGVGKDPVASVGNVLGTNLEGNYSADASEFATSGEVDCSGLVGTTLDFTAWLDVQANKFDQATVEVSNGGDWVVVWENSGEKDTLDTAFHSYTGIDISAVADGESAVQVRFGLVSDGSVEYGGWNVNAVAINAAADDVTDYAWLRGATDDITGPDWNLEANWQVGTPAVAASNNSGQPLASAYALRAGVDPLKSANPLPDGTGDLVLGYAVNGNYGRNMRAEYATTPEMDFTGLRAVKLTFAQWLAVEDAASDRAAIQINNDSETVNEIFSSDFSENTIGDYTVLGNGSAVVNTSNEVINTDGPISVAIAIDTTEQYVLDGSIDLATKFKTGGATLKVQWTDGDTNLDGSLKWTDIDPSEIPPLTLTHSLDSYPFTIPRQTVGIDPSGEDNANFQLRVVISGALIGQDTAKIGSIMLEGVKWAYLFQNEASTPPANLFDTGWSDESIDIDEFAAAANDNGDVVKVRFVMGPTDNFVPGAGQQATEFGGWSLDEIAVTNGTLAWKAVEDSYSFPLALFWGQDDQSVSMTLKNIGTAYWDDSFYFAEVYGPTDEAGVGTIPGLDTEIDRYAVGEVNLEDIVDSGATVDVGADLVAPPLSTIAYLTEADDGTPTSPGDADTSVTGVNWYFFDGDGAGVALYDDKDKDNPDVPKGLVQISRFPDVQLDADDNPYWARYWIEELAGRVPRVVKGVAAAEGPNVYLPEDVVSRAANAVYIVNAKQLPISDPPGFVFKDVPVQGFGNPPSTTTYWAAAYIEAVQKAGIVSGIPPDFTTFAPDNPVDRQGMTKFVSIAANLPGHGQTALAVKNEWLALDEVPFTDVALDVAGPTPGSSVPNPFLPFINACWKADVVQGVVPSPGGSFLPTNKLTRSQLAVFIWRAFMREQGTPVVLAGPGITGTELLTPDVTPSAVAVADWIGYPQVDTADGWKASNIAYASFDAMRLAGAGIADLTKGTDTWQVKFELRDSAKPTDPAPAARTFNFSVSDVDLLAFADDAVVNTGNPYLTFFQLIPSATPTPSLALADPMHGDFILVVSAQVPSGATEMKWAEIARQPDYTSYGRFFYENFELDFTATLDNAHGVTGWKVSGLPATGPVWYKGKPSFNDSNKASTSSHSAVLTQTQAMTRRITTAGWKNVNLTFYVGADNLSSSDTFLVEYSTDGAVNWTTIDASVLSDVSRKKSSDVKLKKVSINLPSSASQNPNFWIRARMDAGSAGTVAANAKPAGPVAWIDNITLKGT